MCERRTEARAPYSLDDPELSALQCAYYTDMQRAAARETDAVSAEYEVHI